MEKSSVRIRTFVPEFEYSRFTAISRCFKLRGRAQTAILPCTTSQKEPILLFYVWRFPQILLGSHECVTNHCVPCPNSWRVIMIWWYHFSLQERRTRKPILVSVDVVLMLFFIPCYVITKTNNNLVLPICPYPRFPSPMNRAANLEKFLLVFPIWLRYSICYFARKQIVLSLRCSYCKQNVCN